MKNNNITITYRQAEEFNLMLDALKKISKDFQSTDQLREDCNEDYGLDYEECLEMSYENIQSLAEQTSKGIRKININK
ncbi:MULTISPECIES: hypothetical protein [unclassified Apibacter]|uniref:hypothetical protein n=2 Tax=unclassified Apibacter TaxID=2630820 RepID=UPI000CFA2757|nr:MULTISPECIES: hypothetical protein [unclassified Apibacter]MCX8676255.1 hypothetical protein [Apibacter sp. B3919]MXO23722.1 hypothetical protein [Apibacter sp. B3924]MXO26600.1 hypothetical protein [Apibacter sp. B3813]MXO29467.1 hypothetical protein [Apibacter sp. B3913]MXO31419.1 hypothetical protein [Apibacter sp. B3912]